MLPSVLPTESDHVPVLAEEIVSLLDPRPGDTVVDGTFGAGGHASLLAGASNMNVSPYSSVNRMQDFRALFD